MQHRQVLLSLRASSIKWWMQAILIGGILLVGLPASMAQPSVEKGKDLFKANCASCHHKNMRDDLTGPALAGVEERWADYPREDLYKWIRNSQKLIREGHPKAVELWNAYKPIVMTPFPNLTDEDIESILMYIKDVEQKGAQATAEQAATADGAPVRQESNWLYWVLLGLLAVFLWVFFKIYAQLDYLAKKRQGIEDAKELTLWDVLTSRGFRQVATFLVVLIAGHYLVNAAIMLGRQQGYQPTQPIRFSHATHAGVHKIDCKFCHDAARRSRHSMIPDNATCMKCHMAIKVGSKYGTQELTKIYAAVGFDPQSGRYIEGYEHMPMEQVAEIFKSWIQLNYMEQSGKDKVDGEVERFVEDQWNEIVRSLTNERKPHVYGPIEWVRIHNLPDHVFFSHQQHVEVGKLDCQQCHGPIEEMEEVYQYNTLSMGWCVNCHRQTAVDMDNPYYEDYEWLHQQFKKGKKVTVEDIGGLECQKCHY